MFEFQGQQPDSTGQSWGHLAPWPETDRTMADMANMMGPSPFTDHPRSATEQSRAASSSLPYRSTSDHYVSQSTRPTSVRSHDASEPDSKANVTLDSPRTGQNTGLQGPTSFGSALPRQQPGTADGIAPDFPPQALGLEELVSRELGASNQGYQAQQGGLSSHDQVWPQHGPTAIGSQMQMPAYSYMGPHHRQTCSRHSANFAGYPHTDMRRTRLTAASPEPLFSELPPATIGSSNQMLRSAATHGLPFEQHMYNLGFVPNPTLPRGRQYQLQPNFSMAQGQNPQNLYVNPQQAPQFGKPMSADNNSPVSMTQGSTAQPATSVLQLSDSQQDQLKTMCSILANMENGNAAVTEPLFRATAKTVNCSVDMVRAYLKTYLRGNSKKVSRTSRLDAPYTSDDPGVRRFLEHAYRSGCGLNPRSMTGLYKCPHWCGFAATTKASLKRHLSIREPQAIWTCPDARCRKFFNRSGRLSEHFEKVHGSKEDKLGKYKAEVKARRINRRCGFCGVICKRWKKFFNHVVRHFEQDGYTEEDWEKDDERSAESLEPSEAGNDDDDSDTADSDSGGESDDDAGDGSPTHPPPKRQGGPGRRDGSGGSAGFPGPSGDGKRGGPDQPHQGGAPAGGDTQQSAEDGTSWPYHGVVYQTPHHILVHIGSWITSDKDDTECNGISCPHNHDLPSFLIDDSRCTQQPPYDQPFSHSDLHLSEPSRMDEDHTSPTGSSKSSRKGSTSDESVSSSASSNHYEHGCTDTVTANPTLQAPFESSTTKPSPVRPCKVRPALSVKRNHESFLEKVRKWLDRGARSYHSLPPFVADLPDPHADGNLTKRQIKTLTLVGVFVAPWSDIVSAESAQETWTGWAAGSANGALASSSANAPGTQTEYLFQQEDALVSWCAGQFSHLTVLDC